MSTNKSGTEPTANDVLIAVMGLTGSGKSTFINLATQSDKKLNVGHGISSCTDTVDVAEPFQLDGRRVFLFDTPGFDDTNKSEQEILRTIAIELEKQFRQGVKLHGIIYTHRISDIRVGGLAKSNFGIFRKMCGDDSLKNVAIVTTMWSKVTEAEGQRRVTELTSLDDFFKPALQKRARMIHHKRDTVESAHQIIRAIFDNHPVPLIIQEELVDENKSIDETSASKEVDKKIAALTAKYEQQLREQLAAAEEARKEKDEQTRKEQLEEAERVQKQLAKFQAEQASHQENYRRLQAQLQEAEQRATAERARQDAALRLAQQQAVEERNRQDAALRLAQQQMAAAAQRAQARPAPQSKPARPVTLDSITSGRRHTMWNKKHEYFATIDRDGEYIIAKDFMESSRQEWIFSKSGRYWTIKCAKTGKYLSLSSRGTLRARSTPVDWRIKPVGHDGDEFRIYATGDWEGQVIALASGNKSERLDIYGHDGSRDETWWIVEAD